MTEQWIAVVGTDELEPGEFHALWWRGTPIVVARTGGGEYRAVRGLCPHQGAILSAGVLTGVTVADEPGSYAIARSGEVLRCPWHGFEFDVMNGRCLGDAKLRVKVYETRVEHGSVWVRL